MRYAIVRRTFHIGFVVLFCAIVTGLAACSPPKTDPLAAAPVPAIVPADPCRQEHQDFAAEKSYFTDQVVADIGTGALAGGAGGGLLLDINPTEAGAIDQAELSGSIDDGLKREAREIDRTSATFARLRSCRIRQAILVGTEMLSGRTDRAAASEQLKIQKAYFDKEIALAKEYKLGMDLRAEQYREAAATIRRLQSSRSASNMITSAPVRTPVPAMRVTGKRQLFARHIARAAAEASYVMAVDAVAFQPWPPPRPSARVTLSPELFGEGTRYRSLGGLAKHIERCFRAGGYKEFAYFSAPGGFAMVTRLEEFSGDGKPVPDDRRWISGIPATTPYQLFGLDVALFARPGGRYRFFVVIVTTDVRGSSVKDVPTVDAANRWIVEGQPVLGETVSDMPLTPSHIGYVNIYEFARDRDQAPALKEGPSIDPMRQFVLAKVDLEFEK